MICSQPRFLYRLSIIFCDFPDARPSNPPEVIHPKGRALLHDPEWLMSGCDAGAIRSSRSSPVMLKTIKVFSGEKTDDQEVSAQLRF